MISNFPDKSITNIGGLETFLFSPYHLVRSLPAATGKLITSPVVFNTGNTFLKGYATLQTLKFTEIPSPDVNGTFYTWRISGFTPGDSDVLASLMEAMEIVRHIVVAKDMAGISRLVGYNAPLDFTADYSPGDDPSSGRGYNFVFSGSGGKRAPVYRVS